MFSKQLENTISDLESTYDLAAFCYDTLTDLVSDQPGFLATYVFHNEKAASYNPNLSLLLHFQEEIKSILMYQKIQGWFFPECLAKILTCTQKLEKNLAPYLDQTQNQATIPFFLLQGIDRYIIVEKGKRTNPAPLNTKYCKKSYIYLNTNRNMMDDAHYNLDFSEIARSETIRNQLQNFHILEFSELPAGAAPVKLVQLYLSDTDRHRKAICAGKRLKVALIPMSRHSMLDFPVSDGANFTVQYRKWHQENAKDWAIRLLDAAIQKKANIILFPEYVCSIEIQAAIHSHLCDLMKNMPEKLQSLLLVAAGSAWTLDDNNVSVIYQYDGKELGKQYKFEKFSNLSDTEPLMEKLSTPGKESLIVDIDGIGKIMIGICRDITNRTYIAQMASIFRPQLLLIPAWSRSVRQAFLEQLKEISAGNLITCGIVCNCCEAFNGLDSFKKELGLIVSPQKKKSTVAGKASFVCRKEEKCNAHCPYGGCFYLLRLSFEDMYVSKGKILLEKKQFFADNSIAKCTE